MRLPGNINLEKGQLQNARVENLVSLPAFVPGEDEGRLVYIISGVDIGFWFGSSDGSSAFQRLSPGGLIAEYTLSNQPINSGVTDTPTLSSGSGAASEKGIISKVSLSSNLSSGQIRVEMFEDTARTSKFYDSFFDLQNLESDRIPAFFELDNPSGNIYVNITNLTGSNGTFSLVIKVTAVLPVQTPPPPGNGSGINSGSAGEGIAYDSVNGRLDADLVTNGGLELIGSVGIKKLQAKLVSGGGISTGASGLLLDSAVAVVSGTDQSTIASLKLFSQFGLKPAGSPGAPSSGTHSVGEFHLDSLLNIYQCISAGTPGTWIFWGWKETRVGGEDDGSSYTSTVSAGSSETLEVSTVGRRGYIRSLLVWGADPARGAVNVDSPFRIACYPNESLRGREQLWSVSGQIRKTFTSTTASSGQPVVDVDDVSATNLDDLVRVVALTGPDEEYQRVIARNTGTLEVTFDENLVNDLEASDELLFVNEFIFLPWRNNSGVALNANKIYLRFFNDDPTEDLLFGYDILFENVGGGVPV